MADTDLHELDCLINDVRDPSARSCDLLLEHIETARSYLLGRMPEEYLFSLRLANDAVNYLANEGQRDHAGESIHHLIEISD